MTDTLNLLPCPFCGKSNIGEPTSAGRGQWAIMCQTTDCYARVAGNTKEKTISKWNTRARSEISVVDLKAIREKMIQAYRTAKEDQPYVASARIDAIIEEIRPYLCDPKQESCHLCDCTGDIHRADGEWLGECPYCKPKRESGKQPPVDNDHVAEGCQKFDTTEQAALKKILAMCDAPHWNSERRWKVREVAYKALATKIEVQTTDSTVQEGKD